MDLLQLTSKLNQLLKIDEFDDYGPNGLQVGANPCVCPSSQSRERPLKKIITAVSICQEVIDFAVNVKADAILVHHGLFWKNDDPCITGIKQQRIKSLLENSIALLAYHLPLDYHPKLGNNIQLAKVLNLKVKESIGPYYVGEFPKADPVHHIEKVLGQKPLHIEGKAKTIKTIAWCTGAAQDYIEQAAAQDVDAYLTGEISERAVYIARETGINLFAAGHYATERYGIKALGEYIQSKFKLAVEFVDIINPV